MKVKIDIKTVEERADGILEVIAQIDDAELTLHASKEEGKDLKTLAIAVAKAYKLKYREELMGEIEVDLDEVK